MCSFVWSSFCTFVYLHDRFSALLSLYGCIHISISALYLHRYVCTTFRMIWFVQDSANFFICIFTWVIIHFNLYVFFMFVWMYVFLNVFCEYAIPFFMLVCIIVHFVSFLYVCYFLFVWLYVYLYAFTFLC